MVEKKKQPRTERDLSQNHSSTKKCVTAKVKTQKFSPPFPTHPLKQMLTCLPSHKSKESLPLQDELFRAEESRVGMGAGENKIRGAQARGERASEPVREDQTGAGTPLPRILQTREKKSIFLKLLFVLHSYVVVCLLCSLLIFN